MAYVRITESLKTDVRRRIQRMAEKAVAPYNSGRVEPGTPEYAALRELAETAAWKEAPHLRGQLPKAWMNSESRMRLTFVNDTDRKRAESVDLTAPDNEPFILPNDRSRGFMDEVKVRPQEMTPEAEAWLANAEQRNQKRNEIVEQYRTVRDQIGRFLENETSLNKALKKMPELEMYIPDEYMERYRAPNPKREKAQREEQEEVEVDRDTIAALGVAHRVTTAAE